MAKPPELNVADHVPEQTDEYTYKVGWETSDRDLVKDAVALWQKYNVLPKGVKPQDRIGDLCIVAYHGDEPVGVSTINIQNFKW